MLSDAQIKSLIDYFIAHQQTPWVSIFVPVVVSLLAAFISFLAFRTSREQLKTVWRHHIRTEWNGLLDACIKDGDFIDATFTNNYYTYPHSKQVTYEAFCYRAWSLVDFIVKRKSNRETFYEAIVSWIVAYHRTWLQRNPFMFASKDFWRIYDEARAKPLTVFQSHGMPHLDGPIADDRTDAVNWNDVSNDYHKWVLGPWAPEMMTPDAANGNRRRNFLLDELVKYAGPGKKQLKILDFGCGPGNIIEYLPTTNFKMIIGLDNSEAALKIASEKAKKFGITFEALRGDMRNFSDLTDCDVIISTNSILPAEPEDVRKMFGTVFKSLKSGGRAFFILPAFDACTTLLDYWTEHYRKIWNDERFVQQCVRAFEATKKLDRENRRFADDGEHQQCFHTEQSIWDDLSVCGFEIVGPIRKIEYPWNYTARHDYGYFPGKPEIWDWYVEAKRR